jgi:hypothetical protein
MRPPLHGSVSPTAAGAAAAETSSSETAEASSATVAPTTSSASEAAKASTTTASPIEDTREKNPEKYAAQRSEQHDQYDDNDQDDAADRKARGGRADGICGSGRQSVRQLNSGVVGNDLSDATGDQQERLAVLFGAHQRNRFALKAAGLAVGQYRFETVADFDAGAMILNGVENQDAAIRFTSHTPFLSKIDRVTFDVGAVERVDGDQRDLGVGFLLNLPADVVDLGDRVLVEDVGEVVDVAGGLELGNGLGERGEAQQHGNRCQTKSHAQGHRKIVQERGEVIANAAFWGKAIRDEKIAMCDSRTTGFTSYY